MIILRVPYGSSSYPKAGGVGVERSRRSLDLYILLFSRQLFEQVKQPYRVLLVSKTDTVTKPTKPCLKAFVTGNSFTSSFSKLMLKFV